MQLLPYKIRFVDVGDNRRNEKETAARGTADWTRKIIINNVRTREFSFRARMTFRINFTATDGNRLFDASHFARSYALLCIYALCTPYRITLCRSRYLLFRR